MDLSILEDVQSEFYFCLVVTVLTERSYNRHQFKATMVDLWRDQKVDPLALVEGCNGNIFVLAVLVDGGVGIRKIFNSRLSLDYRLVVAV